MSLLRVGRGKQRVLVVTNLYPHKHVRTYGVFVAESVSALRRMGFIVDVVFVPGYKGWIYYLAGYLRVLKACLSKNYRYVQMHYGLTGCFLPVVRLAGWVGRTKPLVTLVLHGSDVLGSNKAAVYVSKLSAALSDNVVCVSEEIKKSLWSKRRVRVIPCGVNERRFFYGHQPPENICTVIFPSDPARLEKNFFYFQSVLRLLRLLAPDLEVRYLALKDMTRQEVRYALSSSTAVLLTSDREGSPQIVKEAVAVGCPVVARPVGDVEEQLSGLSHCYITKTPGEMAGVLLRIYKDKASIPRAESKGFVERWSVSRMVEEMVGFQCRVGCC